MAVADHSEAANREELPGPSVPHLATPTSVSAGDKKELQPISLRTIILKHTH